MALGLAPSVAPDVMSLATQAAVEPPRLPMFCGGEWRHPEGEGYLPTRDPTTGEVIAFQTDAGADDLDRAIDAAQDASQVWRHTAATERGRIVAEIGRRIRSNSENFARLDSRDTSSPLTAMRADAEKAARAMERCGGLGLQIRGSTIPATVGRLHFTTQEPWGVVARIVAFNHPTLFTASRLAPPLVAGNAVIIKPSELAPLAALALAELLEDLLPPGLVSVLTGGPELGKAIATTPRIRRLSFTGSVETGLAVSAEAAASGVVKVLTLELGGKNPIVVLPDSDLDAAAAAVVRGTNFTRVQGQSCGSTSRLLVHSSIHDELIKRVVARVERITVGSPLDPATEMGALIDSNGPERCQRYVDRAVKDGAKVLTGGRRPDDPRLESGYFYLPTVLDDVPPSSAAAHEEIFGPVLSVMQWSSEDEAVALANDSRFALAASIWTRDIASAFRLAEAIEASYVWINDVESRYPGVAMGGWKDSGTGVEGASIEEIMSYTRTRTVNVAYAVP